MTDTAETTPLPPEQRDTPPPPTHAGWAVTALLFFWPLSFSAFTHAFNVYPLCARGDIVGAQAASDRTRKLGIISLWLFGILLLLCAIGYTVFIIVMIAHGYGHHHFNHMGPGGGWHHGDRG